MIHPSSSPAAPTTAASCPSGCSRPAASITAASHASFGYCASHLGTGRPGSKTSLTGAAATAVAVGGYAGLVKKIGTSHGRDIQRYKAARKKLKIVHRLQADYASAHNMKAVCLTLTYDDSKNFSPKHISRFMGHFRDKFKRMGLRFSYIWTLECSAKGILHYHALIWIPRTFALCLKDMGRLWPHGVSRIEAARSPCSWVKYITKFEVMMTLLPPKARSYGYGGLDILGKQEIARAAWPCWLRRIVPASEYAVRRKGGGWVNTTTGEIYKSPYKWTPYGIVRVV